MGAAAKKKQPGSQDAEGKVVKKKTPGFSPLPTYVDYEEIFAALEEIRRRNVHGFGYIEKVVPKEQQSGASGGSSGSSSDGNSSNQDSQEQEFPWLNEPFVDPKMRPTAIGCGHGAMVPYVLAWSEGESKSKRIGGDDHGPRRTNGVTATFNAFAVALSHGEKDASGAYVPRLHGDRLAKDAYVKWFGIGDEAPPEGGVAVLVDHNVGTSVVGDKVRRGDVVQLDWKGGGSHCMYVWDVFHDGADVWLQLISSQSSTHGVGVIVSRECLASRGTLQKVRRKGSDRRQPVLVLDREKPWIGTPEARAFYRRYGHWFHGKGDAEKDKGGTLIERIHAGRFHRAFPRFPIALAGSNDVSQRRARDVSSELYHANVEGRGGALKKGGFFPVGSGRRWHGGAHLYPDNDERVFAPLDGVLVAARLTVGEATNDPGFVLIRTKLEIDGKARTFYTLLAHLTKQNPVSVPWIEELDAVPGDDDPRWSANLDRKKRYVEVTEAVAEPHRPLQAVADDGALQIFEKRDVASTQKGTVATGAICEVVTPEDAHGWSKLKTQAGVEGFVFGNGRLVAVHVHHLDRALKDKKDALLRGDAVDFSDLETPIVIRTGEVVGHVGNVGGTHAVHCEIFSGEMVPFRDKTKPDVEDSSDAGFTDREKFEESFFKKLDEVEGMKGAKAFFIKSGTKKDDDKVLGEEICRFFATNPLRAQFRLLVTKHLSEWGDKIDYDQLLSKDQWKHLTDAQKESFKKSVTDLCWWKDGFLGKELPADQLIYHYNPVEFLLWLDELREKDTSGALHASVFELNHI